MAPEPQRHPSETSTPRQRAFLIFFPPGLTRPPAIAPTLSRAARIVGFSNSAVQPRAVLDWACLPGNARREKRFVVAALNGRPIHSMNCSSGPGAPLEFGSWINVRCGAEAQTGRSQTICENRKSMLYVCLPAGSNPGVLERGAAR